MPTVHWRSEAHEDIAVLLRDSRADEPCDMFHVAIAEVDVDGLGTLWLEDQPYDAAQLPCGHAFNACAIAVHFCTNDMRCPVCRRGPLDRALLASMAPRMQDALLKKKLAMHNAGLAALDDDITVDVDVNVAAISCDFVFEIHMQWASRAVRPVRPADETHACLTLATPLQLAAAPSTHESPAHPAHPAHFEQYTTQRSFQRRFNVHLKHARPSANVMFLSLTHPLLPEVVHSAMFDTRALHLFADAGMRIPLSRDMGFVLPIHTDAGVRLELYLNTFYISMACVQTMLHFQHYLRM
jgi:hypothetical protein